MTRVVNYDAIVASRVIEVIRAYTKAKGVGPTNMQVWLEMHDEVEWVNLGAYISHMGKDGVLTRDFNEKLVVVADAVS